MTTERFDPASADTKWQAAWDAARVFEADSNSAKPKSFVLEMFPYPSGRACPRLTVNHPVAPD